MILAGDWAPGNRNIDFKIDVSSCLLANLEAPYLDQTRGFFEMSKAGPHLWTNSLPKTDCKIVFSLANNHMMDYGLSGLESTLSKLNQKGFSACGAGKNIQDARLPIIVEDNGVRIGIIACCEAQFGVATCNQAGVAEFGQWVYQVIRELRETVNYVIVSVHAGVEDSPWPAPYIRELYRSYINAGATVVHGHHSHVPQGYEEYGEGLIFYGMGNFSIDPDKWRDYPNGLWSLGAQIDFDSKPLRWQLLTYEIRQGSGASSVLVTESTTEEKHNHQHYLGLCVRPLVEPELFDGLWQEVALRAYHHYGSGFMGFSRPVRRRYAQARKGIAMILKALFNLSEAVYRPNKDDYLLRYVMLNCESHRQIMATALGILGGEIRDLRTDESRELADEMMPWSVSLVPA